VSFISRKRIKKPWLEPAVGDIVVFDEDYETYEGIIIDVVYCDIYKITSQNSFDILWIQSEKITREKSKHIQKNYVLLENADDNK